MTTTDRVQRRLDELDAMAEEIARGCTATKEQVRSDWFNDGPPRERICERLDGDLLIQWHASALSLLEQVFTPEHPTSQSFKLEHSLSSDSTHEFRRLRSLFRSAKSDYEGGYLFDVRNLVHAEVFSDELEQAEHFLGQGHKVPAAVVAGTVLETTLRRMCEQHPDLNPGKADKMISDLAKQAIFNKMRADQLRAWMKTRNSAAHGKPNEFNEGDVARMIDGIRDFVANHMS